MRILLIADTHYNYSSTEIYNYLKYPFDACISLGDVESIVLKIVAEYCKQHYIPMYAIPGNHDTWDYLKDIPYIIDIHLKQFKLGDYSCMGFGGSYKYKNTNAPLFTDSESIELLDTMPKCNILFTHDSLSISNLKFHQKRLKNILCRTFYNVFNHPGLFGITKYLEKNKPKYNFHGHHHINLEYRYKHTICQCIYGFKIINIGGENHGI